MNAFPSTADSGNRFAYGPALEFGGRLLMAALFFIAGIRKVLAWSATAVAFGKLGLPLPEITLVGVIIIEIGGAVLLVLGWRTRAVALAMALFTIGAGLIGHQFWNADPVQVNNQVNHFLKVLGIIGGLLHIAAFAQRKPVPNV